MTRAERLKAARQSLGLSLTDMAERLQLRGTQAKDDLRKMEEGVRPVTGPVLVAAEAVAHIAHVKAQVEHMERNWWGDGVNPFDAVLDALEVQP